MNIDRHEAIAAIYRVNTNSTVLILHRYAAIGITIAEINRYAVVKFVRSPGENNKRAICKRPSVGEETENESKRETERERERGGDE